MSDMFLADLVSRMLPYRWRVKLPFGGGPNPEVVPGLIGRYPEHATGVNIWVFVDQKHAESFAFHYETQAYQEVVQ